MTRLCESGLVRCLFAGGMAAAVWTAAVVAFASTRPGGFPDLETLEFDASDESRDDETEPSSRFWPETVRPKRHLSINLTTFNFSFNVDMDISYYSPGAEISMEWIPYRFFSIGVFHGAFVVMDGDGARLVLERLGIVPRLLFPVTSNFFFSIGIPVGLDWGMDARKREGGAGLFAAAMIGLRGFWSSWGFTLDARCGPDYLWGRLDDVLITGPQVNLGAVYRF